MQLSILQWSLLLAITSTSWHLFLVGWQWWHIQSMHPVDYPSILDPVYGIFDKAQIKCIVRKQLIYPLITGICDLIVLVIVLAWAEKSKQRALRRWTIDKSCIILLCSCSIYCLTSRLAASAGRRWLSAFRDAIAMVVIPGSLFLISWMAATKQAYLKPTAIVALTTLLTVLIISAMHPLMIGWWGPVNSHASLPKSYFEPIAHLLHLHEFPWQQMIYLFNDCWWSPSIISMIGPYLVIPAGSDRWWGGLKPMIGVLAHELGHWQAGDNELVTFIQCIYAVAIVILLSRWNSNYGRLGSIMLGLFIAHSIHYLLIAPIWHALRWQMEMAADAHAVSLGYRSDLAMALTWADIRAGDHGLISRLWALWHHNHPPYELRLSQFL